MKPFIRILSRFFQTAGHKRQSGRQTRQGIHPAAMGYRILKGVRNGSTVFTRRTKVALFQETFCCECRENPVSIHANGVCGKASPGLLIKRGMGKEKSIEALTAGHAL